MTVIFKTIKPVKVIRDEAGMGTHPDFPSCDEIGETLGKRFRKWLDRNNGGVLIDKFEDRASEELQKSWFELGEYNCSDWTPKCNIPQAFLISIHDTEDGPIAVFFIPWGEV